MKLRIELEKVGNDFDLRLLAPDGVVLLESFGLNKQDTLRWALVFIEQGCSILG